MMSEEELTSIDYHSKCDLCKKEVSQHLVAVGWIIPFAVPEAIVACVRCITYVVVDIVATAKLIENVKFWNNTPPKRSWLRER